MSSREDKPRPADKPKDITIQEVIHALADAIQALQDDMAFSDKIHGTPLENEYRRHVEVLLDAKARYEMARDAQLAKFKAGQRNRMIIPGRGGH